jgi:hypothetical protein
MIPLHPYIKKLITDFDFDIVRKSANEVTFMGKVHLLEPKGCVNCDCQGKHLYGSMKGHAYTQEDLSEDPELLPDMLDGKYDVSCEFCDGNGYLMHFVNNEDNKYLRKQTSLVARSEQEWKDEIRHESLMLGER